MCSAYAINFFWYFFEVVNRGIKLSLLDRLLTPLILLAMIIGIVAGILAPDVQDVFNSLEFRGVSLREHLRQLLLWDFLYTINIITLISSYCHRFDCHDVAYSY